MRILILGFVIACYAPQINAQMLFRCGKQYQDRPCDPAPAVVHGPSTVTPSITPESTENRLLRQQAEEERQKANRQYQCAQYDQDMRNIYEIQGAGGNTSSVSSLNDRARAIEAQRKSAGCG